MAAFNFHRRQTRRWWYVGATLVVAAFFTVFFVVAASADLSGGCDFSSTNSGAPGDCLGALPGSTFAGGDGNLLASPITFGSTDWENVAGLNKGIDLPSGTGDNSFGQGTKTDSSSVTVVSGSIPPNKSDLTRFYEASEVGSNSHNFLYLAFERSNVLGSANMNFEINQKAQPDLTATGAKTLNRTAGDLLVTFDFTNGGGRPTIGILRWLTSASVPTVTGFPTNSCFSANSFPCWGDKLTLDGTDSIAAVNNLDAVTDPVAPNAPRNLPALTFGETAIDLTAAGVFPAGTCSAFGSTMVTSRSSASFTSEVKDFIAPVPVNITNCGSITIIKHTDPRHLNQNFGYTATGGISPSSFKLNDQSALAISGISTGTTTSTITTKTADGFSTAGDTFGVTISSSDSTPSIDGNYTATAVDSTHFTIPLAAPVTVAGTAGSVTTDTEVYSGVQPGSYNVTEAAEPPGFSLESLTCDNTGGNSGEQHSTGSPQADITVVPGGSTTCTYQNKATGEIKIVKHTNPRGIDQVFNYSSNLGTPDPSNVSGTVACPGGSAGVNSGNFCLNDHAGTDPSSGGSDNTLDYTNVPVGSYNVTEGAEPNSGWSLQGLSCTATGTGSSGAQDTTNLAKANITLAAGGVVTCTYQNKATGSITIIKNTDPRHLNQNFGYTASGGSISPTSFKLNDRSALGISSISAANPAVVQTSAAIATGLSAGDKIGVTISGSNASPSANGNWTGTVIDSTHVSIPLAVTTAGTAQGTVTFNTEVYSQILAATTYTVNEGSEPSGFTFESLTCTNNGTTDNSVVSGSTVQIDLAANDNWVCTYVNQQNTATLATLVGAGPVFPGVTVNDTATVTGNQAADTPSGDVTFYLCDPTTVTANGGNCSSGGTNIGTGTLSATSTAGQASATSPDVNTSADPLSAGIYCFRASWPGDTNYPGTLTEWGGTSGTDECFTVSQIGTSTTTEPSSTSNPLPGLILGVNFGDQTIYDHAVVQALTTGDGTPTGTVTFTICSPSDLAAANAGAGESSCVTGGTQVGSPVTLGAALGDSPPDAAADSIAYTNNGDGVNQTGTWCWRAVFSPSGTNGSNYTGSSDTSTGECFTVVDTFSNTSQQNWLPNDEAVVATAHGAPLNGTLDVQLYTGDNCGATSGSAVSDQDYQKTLTNATALADRTLTTSNTDYKVSTGTSVSWLVTFTSTDDNVTGSTHCESSSLTITN